MFSCNHDIRMVKQQNTLKICCHYNNFQTTQVSWFKSTLLLRVRTKREEPAFSFYPIVTENKLPETYSINTEFLKSRLTDNHWYIVNPSLDCLSFIYFLFCHYNFLICLLCYVLILTLKCFVDEMCKLDLTWLDTVKSRTANPGKKSTTNIGIKTEYIKTLLNKKQ